MCEILDHLVILKSERATYQNDLSFEDMEKYGIDGDLIVKNLQDPSVIEYLKHDKNIAKEFDKMKELFDFIKEYVVWKNGGRPKDAKKGNVEETGMGADYKKYFR